jgi:hypothetical protein
MRTATDRKYEAARAQEMTGLVYTPAKQQTFSAEDVWALAVAVDRINEGYFKEDQWRVTGADSSELAKKANKSVVRDYLRKNDFSIVTDADRETGIEYRRHFTSYTMLAIQGQLNDFQHQALKIANMDQFTGRNMLEFAIVSCLPSIARRDCERTAIKREVFASVPLKGEEGDAIEGDILVMSANYSKEYLKYRVTARMGESVVDFWIKDALTKDETYRIKGKIKGQRDNGITQLNFVKKKG